MTGLAGELFDLSGEVALVTGASSGLGWRFCEVLAAQGARVVACARRTERLEALVAAVRAAGGEAEAVRMDVTDRAAIAAAFDAAENAFGPVSVLVNNAGIAAPAPVLEQSPETWRAVLDTNLDAVYFCAQEGARRMVAAGVEGRIVNIASLASFTVARGLSAYSVAKAGVAQLTRALALELARHGIRVNAIAPGYVLTEINRDFFATKEGADVIRGIPMRRIADPAELDGTFLLLASNASRFMTGSIVLIDGGQSLTAG